MRKIRLLSIIAAAVLTVSAAGCSGIQSGEYEATFQGVEDWRNVTREEALSRDSAIWQFEIDGETQKLCVEMSEEDYTIPNILMNGHEYKISVKDGRVVAAEPVNEKDFEGTAKGYVPGERTVLNLLKTAAAPMGKTSYVYGGGWDFQDEGSSVMATTIGVFPEWENFYHTTDADYSNELETCPENGWNCYYYAGLDCSAYVGWLIYNVMNTESGLEGFVGSSTKTAKKLSEEYGYGTYEHYDGMEAKEEDYRKVSKDLAAGDIVSMEGHVYVVVGTCEDDSVVIISSTATNSVTGALGGGIQLSAISCKGAEDTSCEAYQLACGYMEENYPEWTAKYPVVLKSAADFFCFTNENAGVMHWNIDETGLEDPENVREMNAAEVLELLAEADD